VDWFELISINAFLLGNEKTKKPSSPFLLSSFLSSLDNYFWLRERENPAVEAHLQEEALYAEDIGKNNNNTPATLASDGFFQIAASGDSVYGPGWSFGALTDEIYNEILNRGLALYFHQHSSKR